MNSPLGDDRGGRTTRDDTQKVIPATNDATCMFLNQLLQGNGHGLLHCARIVDVAGDIEQLKGKCSCLG